MLARPVSSPAAQAGFIPVLQLENRGTKGSECLWGAVCGAAELLSGSLSLQCRVSTTAREEDLCFPKCPLIFWLSASG